LNGGAKTVAPLRPVSAAGLVGQERSEGERVPLALIDPRSELIRAAGERLEL
jgi:hypothetical protein